VAKRRRTITRQGITRPKDTNETFDDIKRRVGNQQSAPATTTPGQPATTVYLRRDSIHVASAVFQWRQPKRNQLPSDDHILGMAKSVHENRKPLPPILVFPLDSGFYVVDGHHRLAAYDTAAWDQDIPAHIFQGSLEDAYRAALRRNSRDKLPMSSSDKFNAAWTLVKLNDPRDSRAVIVDLTGVGKGTVDNMRSVWRTLNDGKHGEPEELRALSWPQARRRAEGHEDYKELDDWREQKANDIVAALERAKLDGRLTRDPDITALALAKLADGLPAALMAEWSEEPERPFDPHEDADDDDF